MPLGVRPGGGLAALEERLENKGFLRGGYVSIFSKLEVHGYDDGGVFIGECYHRYKIEGDCLVYNGDDVFNSHVSWDELKKIQDMQDALVWPDLNVERKTEEP